MAYSSIFEDWDQLFTSSLIFTGVKPFESFWIYDYVAWGL